MPHGVRRGRTALVLLSQNGLLGLSARLDGLLSATGAENGVAGVLVGVVCEGDGGGLRWRGLWIPGGLPCLLGLPPQTLFLLPGGHLGGQLAAFFKPLPGALPEPGGGAAPIIVPDDAKASGKEDDGEQEAAGGGQCAADPAGARHAEELSDDAARQSGQIQAPGDTLEGMWKGAQCNGDAQSIEGDCQEIVPAAWQESFPAEDASEGAQEAEEEEGIDGQSQRGQEDPAHIGAPASQQVVGICGAHDATGEVVHVLGVEGEERDGQEEECQEGQEPVEPEGRGGLPPGLAGRGVGIGVGIGVGHEVGSP